MKQKETKRLSAAQLPPTDTEAVIVLRKLLGEAVYPDIDATTTAGARKLLARWQIGEAAIQKLENATCGPIEAE